MSKLTEKDIEALRKGKEAEAAPPEQAGPPEEPSSPEAEAAPPEPERIDPGYMLLIAPAGVSSVSIEGQSILISKKGTAKATITQARILIAYYNFKQA